MKHRLLLTLILMQSCSQSAEPLGQSTLMADDTPTDLGQGRNSLTSSGTSTCLTNSNVTEVRGGGSTPMTQIIHNRRELAEALNLSAAEVQAGTAVNPLVQLVQEIDENPRFTYLLVGIKRITRTAKISNPQLKQNVVNFYQNDYKTFVKYCGDSYMASVEYGDSLLGVIPIVVDSPEQKIRIEDDILSVNYDANKVLEKVQTYAALSVPSLHSGDSNPVTRTITDFTSTFLALKNGQTPMQATPIGPVYLDYQNNLNIPANASQTRRSLYVQAYRNLSLRLIATEQCKVRVKRAQSNPVEFSALSQGTLDQLENAAALQYTEIGSALENCLVDSCVTGVCDVSLCSTASPSNPLVDNCEQTGPKILETDAMIYRQWFESNGALGAMKGLSQTIGSSHAQEFEETYLVRPSFASSSQVIPMKTPVFKRWSELRTRLLDPLPVKPYAFNGAEVADFAGGKLFLNPDQHVFYVNAFFPYLSGLLPSDDEKTSVRSSVETWAALPLNNGSIGIFRTNNPILYLTTEVLKSFYLQKGTVNWGLPIEVQENPATWTWYIKNIDNSYLWQNAYGYLSSMSGAMGDLYKRLGGGASPEFGMPLANQICLSNKCSVNFERGVLEIYADTGKRVCPDGLFEGATGSCIKLENPCILRPSLCHLRPPPGFPLQPLPQIEIGPIIGRGF